MFASFKVFFMNAIKGRLPRQKNTLLEDNKPVIKYFEDLTVRDDIEDIEPYRDALNYIFSKNNITNIAMTGPYGAGKSSILETYKKQHPDKTYLHISLAAFQGENQVNTTPKKDIKGQTYRADDEYIASSEEAILEGKILNSLLHQIDSTLIPRTKFIIKKAVQPWTIYTRIFGILLFISALSYVVFKSQLITWVQDLRLPHIVFIYNILDSDWSIIIALIISLVFIVYLIFSLVKIQQNRHVLKKLVLRGNEIEIFDDNTESCFDKYLNEVIYLFEESKVDVFVFEDMDRFECNFIFSKLREVNTLLKQRCAFRGANHVIRFLYLLRDDMFTSKDRTKFFDFIIPIVPALDRSNSYDHFLRKFKAYGLENELDTHFLQGLSLYIDDFRLLTNIINEYMIYRRSIDSTGLLPDKQFAVITYKNIFPRDFAKLQLGFGFVHQIFAERDTLKQRRLDTINNTLRMHV